MRSFDFEEPERLDDALGLLAGHGPDAALLAGGQSLLILMRQRLAAPGVLVSLGRVAGLRRVVRTGDGLVLGAMTTYASLAATTEVTTGWGLLATAASRVGSPHIRVRGTIGGSLCHADPAGDVPVALIALDAAIMVAGPGRTRRIAADGFATGLFRTGLRAGELLESIELPAQPPTTTVGFERFCLREGELPLAQAAVRLTWDGDVVREARVAVGGGGPCPARMTGAEMVLAGARRGQPSTVDGVREAARAAARPFADVRGSAAWKRDVVAAVVARAVASALEDPSHA